MFHAAVVLALCCLAADVDRDVPKRVVQGEFRCRVLLIDFAGREHVHPRESFETIIFGKNVRATPDRFREPMRGSVRDFYEDISDGRLHATGEVMPWVRSRLKVEDLPHWSVSHNAGKDWWQPVAADAMSLNHIPKDDRIGGKPVDFYVIIYGGPSRGYLKSAGKEVFLGAGRRDLTNRGFGGGKVPFWEERWNGKRIVFCPERWRQDESGLFGVGMLCHELGHAFCGFWDLYTKSGGDFGHWSVMALGEKTHFPADPTAFHRYMAGWLAYDVPKQHGRHSISLPPVDANRAVRLVNGPMPWADSLIVEYRVRWSPLDRNLPAEGLLVDEAYGNRRVRVVEWDTQSNKPLVTEQRLRLLRADGNVGNAAGDVFRQGSLTLFGTPSAASSATDCGYWELSNIRLPKESRGSASLARSRDPAAFDAVYCPRQVAVRQSDATIHLGQHLPTGDYRLYVQMAQGACTVKSDETILEIPKVEGAGPQWGLVDVHRTADNRPLDIVPSSGSKLLTAQVVNRRPVGLNLLAKPYAEQLASGFKSQIITGASLGSKVWVGGAVAIPLEKSKAATAATSLTCPGGVLRLALRAFSSDRKASPDMTLVVHDGDKRQKYLSHIALDTNRPEFFLIDFNHLAKKPIRVEIRFESPGSGRVVLWEAGFVAQ